MNRINVDLSWADDLADMQNQRDAAIERAEALAARVGELEAENAALRAQLAAANEWRDFSTRPPSNEPIQILTVIEAILEWPSGLYRIVGDTSEWQSWRPAPPQE